MKKKCIVFSIFIIVSLSITVLKTSGNVINPTIADTRSVPLNDFVMPDPAVYINTTYNDQIINTENDIPNVNLDSTVTIWYTLFIANYANGTVDFLRLKGNDGGKTLDINQNTGPFFTFVSDNGTHSFFKIDYTVVFDGKTTFYAIYNVFTPCGMFLASEEIPRHYLVTSSATDTSTSESSSDSDTSVSESSGDSSPGFELIGTLGVFVIITVSLWRKRK
ncbi:MAG: Heimdall-CTERM domain-containing surface protein [Promethearchaeota archaeon]